jgi:predicted nucleotidyltransferase
MDYADENKNLEKAQRELTALRNPNLGLNAHRFRLDHEAHRNSLKELKAFHTQESKKFPEFLGIGFFGSQVKGYATEGSDWDLVLLFDENRSTYSDIGDSLTAVNRELPRISEKSISPLFCVISEQRISLFLGILKRLVLDFKADCGSLRTAVRWAKRNLDTRRAGQ